MPDADARIGARAWALVASVALHVGVFAWLATRPQPERAEPPDELYEVAIWEDTITIAADADESDPSVAIPDDARDASDPAAADRAEDRDASEPAAAGEMPRTDADRDDATSSGAPRIAARSRQTDSGTDDAAIDSDAAIERGDPSGGIALHGLRSSRRRSSLAPSIDPPTHGRAIQKIAGDAAFDGPARDGKPRSLSEAGFRPRRRKDGTHVKATEGFRAIIHPDGRMTFRDIPRGPSVSRGAIVLPGMAEAMRVASGQELYIKQKRELLESTYELRVAMAIAHAEANLEKRLRSLYRELVAIWYDADKPAADRRAELFARWDECEEGLRVSMPSFVDSVPEEIDTKRRAAADKARAKIEAFIRTHVPASDPDAFPEAELRRLNATRKSQTRFAPYD